MRRINSCSNRSAIIARWIVNIAFRPSSEAALIAGAIVNRDELAPLAYVSGTVGVLVGADLLRLREAMRTGAPVLSLGGAGTRDGIFLTGVMAVLLA